MPMPSSSPIIDSTFRVTPKKGDLADTAALAALLKGHDAVISAVRFRTFKPGQLIDAVKQSGVRRLLVVGGAATLEVKPGVMLLDTPEFPAAAKEEATAGRARITGYRLRLPVCNKRDLLAAYAPCR